MDPAVGDQPRTNPRPHLDVDNIALAASQPVASLADDHEVGIVIDPDGAAEAFD
jgi:hypothetical protein